jgi:hypothetical protein
LKDDKNKNSDFAVGRHRSRKMMMMIIVPISIVVIGVLVGLYYTSNSPLNGSQMLLHNHVSLNVTLDGNPISVPAHIGIQQPGKPEDSLLYGDHSLDKFGMPGMSALHTHDDTGTIHIESNTVRNFTLGEFLSIWRGLDVDGKTVKASTNDKLVTDFSNIILNDGEKIKLDIVP